MNNLYTLSFVNPSQMDALSPDKILPPSYRIVQNRQPLPAGSFKRRNAIPDTSIVAASADLETQLISPLYLRGSSSDLSVAVVTKLTSGSKLSTLYKWSGSAWATASITNTTTDRLYSVSNALDVGMDYGNATGGAVTYLEDTDKSWETDEWVNGTITFVKTVNNAGSPADTYYYNTGTDRKSVV